MIKIIVKIIRNIFFKMILCKCVKFNKFVRKGKFNRLVYLRNLGYCNK